MEQKSPINFMQINRRYVDRFGASPDYLVNVKILDDIINYGETLKSSLEIRERRYGREPGIEEEKVVEFLIAFGFQPGAEDEGR